MWVSGTDTAERWHAIRDQLDPGTGKGPWSDAFAFLQRRLETRYFAPIDVMQMHLGQQGEGFAIVTLQCALIEFLAALVEGRHFVHSSKDPAWDQHAYFDSSGLFVRFLRREFADWFETDDEGIEFYRKVRCGLLHEAMTKGRWHINLSGERGIDVATSTVYRDTLQQVLKDWLAAYEGRLIEDAALREAFIRKLDHVVGQNPA
jgi:hypothetical protein